MEKQVQTTKKNNQGRKEAWKSKENEARERLRNATTKAEKNKAKKDIKHAINQQRKSENHANRGQGN